MSRRGASAGRAENRTSDAGLAIPAFAGVVRTTCEDQGRQSGGPLRRWRIPANAAGTVCGAFFELTRRPGRIAPQLRRAFGAAIRAPQDRRIGSWFGSVIEGARRDAVIQPIPYRLSHHPGRSRNREAFADRSFSARQPEAPGPFYDAVEQPR